MKDSGNVRRAWINAENLTEIRDCFAGVRVECENCRLELVLARNFAEDVRRNF